MKRFSTTQLLLMADITSLFGLGHFLTNRYQHSKYLNQGMNELFLSRQTDHIMHIFGEFSIVLRSGIGVTSTRGLLVGALAGFFCVGNADKPRIVGIYLCSNSCCFAGIFGCGIWLAGSTPVSQSPVILFVARNPCWLTRISAWFCLIIRTPCLQSLLFIM